MPSDISIADMGIGAAFVAVPLFAFLLCYPLADLFYAIGVLRVRRLLENPPKPSGPVLFEHDVTVQVPIYNSGEKLLPLLRSIKKFDIRCPIQLLDSSNDGKTTELIEQFFGGAERVDRTDYWTKRWGNVALIHFREKLGSKAWALQKGTELVATSFIAVFDSDWEISPEFFQTLLPAIKADANIGFVQATWRSANAAKSWVSMLDAISVETEHMIEDVLRSFLRIPFTIHGSAFIVRADVVKALGWRDQFLSEDVDLAMRICLQGHCRPVYPTVAKRRNFRPPGT